MNKRRGIVFQFMIKTFQLRKILIIAAASLILPALAHAKDIDWGKDKGEKSDRDDRGGKGEKGDPRVSNVPEASPVWVLLPFVGAVLLFSTRQLFLKKATE
jgi:hypothetical protein